MERPLSARRGRERAVLAVALVSAAALAWAAFAAPGDPDAAAEVAVARIAGEVADGVRAEWERMATAPEPPGASGARVFRTEPRQSLHDPTGGSADVDGVETDRGGTAAARYSPDVFALRLRDVEELELRQGRVAEALAVVRELAAEPELSRDQRRRARALAVPIALKLDETDVAREQWRAFRADSLAVPATVDELYAITALAASPVLSAAERAAEQRALADAWAAGALAPEVAGDRLRVELADGGLDATFALAPGAAELVRRLRALAPAGADDPAWERGREARAAAALARRLGGFPAPPGDGRWHASRAPAFALDGAAGAAEPLARAGAQLDPAETVLVVARAVDGAVEAALVPRAAVAAELAARAALPAGFALDLGDGAGDAAERGPVVRARTPLSGDALGFALRHADPARLAAAERDRLRLVRAALLLLALATVAAGGFAFRAMRRERALADLRTRFVAGFSHDLRTPLASILLLAENLERGRVATDEARARYYRSIRREADRLRRLVDDVLDFARLERGRPAELALEEVDAAALVRALAEAGTERAEALDGRLVVAEGLGDPVAGRVRVPADVDALRRVVLNLVENALRHGGVREVEMGAEVADGALVVEVRDRGRGIPPERRAEVFRPFTRLAAAEGSAAGGTGLGLAIARELARAHGGELELRDGGGRGESGRGCTFALSLPLVSSSGAIGAADGTDASTSEGTTGGAAAERRA